MKHGRLYRYYSERRWADDFLNGKLLFRSLSYFRDYEDKDVRGDSSEGSYVYDNPNGLQGYNQRQGKPFALPDYNFISTINHKEIFVFCLSSSHTEERCRRFNAVAYVEIRDISKFCQRVTAGLPFGTSFPDWDQKAQRKRQPRIGHHVEYYDKTEDSGTRWALPDRIATSKDNYYVWQKEFRLAFSLENAFQVENVVLKAVPKNHPKESLTPSEHQDYLVNVRSLRDICCLHEV